MRLVDAAETAAALTFPDLIETLRRAFRAGAAAPLRHHHTVSLPGEADATLLLMPAWADFGAPAAARSYIGVKIVGVFPGNAGRGLPSVAGSYLLMAGATGEPLALIDGPMLTLRRTAAASALAASYLAPPQARRLVMIGAGALAPHLVEAHAAVRPIEEVLVWNRSADRARRLAERLSGRPYRVTATEDLEAAVRAADIVSAATMTEAPLLRGDWLRPGTHVDLVGGFTPAMREADDAAVRRARLFVDTRAGALAEAGDLVQPLRAGLIASGDIAGDLFDLCRDTVPGRRDAAEITLFKSVGTALEDLAAAARVFEARREGEDAPAGAA